MESSPANAKLTTCPRCQSSVATDDAYCRDCGWSLQLDPTPDAAIVQRVQIDERTDSSLLPRVRSDLSPLVPTARRALTVLAAAAAADWVIRAGMRAAVRDGTAMVARNVISRPTWGRRRSQPAAPTPDTLKAGTIVIEQRFTMHRS